MLTAPLFALQHVSLAAGNPLVVAVVLMALAIVLAIPLRLFLGWVDSRTGSLFLVGLSST